MVLLFHKIKIYLSDPLANPIENYQILYCRLVQFYNEVIQALKPKLVENQNSKLCGLLFIYFSHVIFGYEYPSMLNMNQNVLLRFANHML